MDTRERQKIEKDISILRELSENTLEISKKITREADLPPQELFARMGLTFLSKQREHMGGVLVLTQYRKGRDATLIARSMLEGLAQLVFANEDRQERAKRYTSFLYVLRWRALKTFLDSGGDVSPERRAKIEQDLAKTGDQFLTKKGRRRQREGKEMSSSCYSRDWWVNPGSIKDLIQKVLGKSFVDEYDQLSAWHHWNPRKTLLDKDVVTWEGPDISYFPPHTKSSAEALEVGFQCLLRTVIIVDDSLNLGLKSEFEELRQRYLLENLGVECEAAEQDAANDAGDGR